MMPKLKKQPHNAYYYFMVDRKQKLEGRGHRFLGGMKEVAEVVREEWRVLPEDEKDYFTQLANEAKEREKLNLHNKFTVTGESYAQLQERENDEKRMKHYMEDYVNDLTITSKTPPDKRNFIIVKVIHSCYQHHEDRYWPVELAMGVFNLNDGLKCNYWSLINTKEAPFGFASTVKESSEETALPVPGSPLFKPENSDYKKILNNFRKFVEKFLEEYPREFVVFALDTELKPIDGCLNWLYDNAVLVDNDIPVFQAFFKNLKFYSLPKLVLRFAMLAKARNPGYNNVMAQFKELDQAAIAVLNEGCFDYRDDITCPHHRLDENSYKMNLCCRNIVLRRIYLMLNHFVPAMNIPLVDGHDIEKFASKSKLCRPMPKPAPVSEPPKKEPKVESEDNALEAVWGDAKSRFAASGKPDTKDDLDDDMRVSTGFTVGVSRLPPMSHGVKKESEGTSFDDDDFPILSSNSRSSSSGLGMGRGRGSAKMGIDTASMPGVGRGRGRL